MAVANSTLPTTFLVGDLARIIDITPRDMLDELVEAGVRVFWHDGQKFRSVEQLSDYLSQTHFFSPLPELEFELGPSQASYFAEAFGVDVTHLNASAAETAERTNAKPLRKFVTSEVELPQVNHAAVKRQG